MFNHFFPPKKCVSFIVVREVCHNPASLTWNHDPIWRSIIFFNWVETVQPPTRLHSSTERVTSPGFPGNPAAKRGMRPCQRSPEASFGAWKISWVSGVQDTGPQKNLNIWWVLVQTSQKGGMEMRRYFWCQFQIFVSLYFRKLPAKCPSKWKCWKITIPKTNSSHPKNGGFQCRNLRLSRGSYFQVQLVSGWKIEWWG